MAEENVVPLDFAVIGFRGNKFNGEIAPEIYRLVSEGLVDIIDLVFISKDKDGQYTSFEAERPLAGGICPVPAAG